MSTMTRRFALVLLGALIGCAESPAVPFPGNEVDAGPGGFADIVIAYSSGGQLTNCIGGLPACGDQPPTCAANAVLGRNDGMRYTLGAGDRLEVAFRCGVIGSSGIRIWSAVPAGGAANVEVSDDGSYYETLGILDMTDQQLALTRTNTLQRARYVRIVDRGAGGIAIDAVEALP